MEDRKESDEIIPKKVFWAKGAEFAAKKIFASFFSDNFLSSEMCDTILPQWDEYPVLR